MLIRLIALTIIITLITWWLYPLDQVYLYVLILGAVGIFYFLERKKFSILSSLFPKSNEKIVYLDEFRRQKRQKKEKEEVEDQFVVVFEAQLVIEADLVASMLESHNIATHVLNRHNASILIHPMNELTVKVLVSREDSDRALQLIQSHQETSPQDFPGGTSA